MKKKQTEFKSRMFYSYSALIVLSVGVFLVALALLITQTGRSEQRAAQHEAVVYKVRQFESVMRELDMLAAQAAQNAHLISYFVPYKADTGDHNDFDDNLLEFIDASSLLQTLNGADNTTARISVYNMGGDYVSAGTLYVTPERIKQTLSDKALIASQLEGLATSPDRRLIQPPAKDPFSTSSKSRLMSILRPLSNAYVSEVYGIVSVQQDVSALERLGFEHRQAQGRCLLITDSGDVILASGADALDGALIESALRLAAPEAGTAAGGEVKAGVGELYLSVARMDISGWLLVMAQPKNFLTDAYGRTVLVLGLCGLMLIAVLLGVVYFMADRITRPLSDLSASVEHVSLSNMALRQPPPKDSSPSEIIALDAAFRTMLERLNESFGLEMRAYLYALQSQMNPHFLYNTLSVICVAAEEEGARKSNEMMHQLSGMLRYVASYDSDPSVLLEDEIRYTEQYLKLMKVRYEDNFDYSLDVERGIGAVRVPKLILQPLTENCFKHGFDKVRPPWRIRITVQAQGDRFLITVSDNGKGMTDDEIARLNERIETSVSDLTGNYKALSIGGMGLVNTVLRLKLQLGVGANWHIMKGPNGGTIIQIGGPA